MKGTSMLLGCVLGLTVSVSGFAKSGTSFNMATDIHYDEIQRTFLGICICQYGPFTVTGKIWTYWEPFAAVDSVTTPFYSPYFGSSIGESTNSELSGKNVSQDSVTVSESTFSQTHVYPIPKLSSTLYPCSRHDNPYWISEYDAQWQNDELSALIEPEASLFANLAMQMACMTDATATNLGATIDAMPWCIGSGGSSYPMTGHIDNDNIVQANNTAAARLIYKLNRLGMICDPAQNLCGCMNTPVWIKSHYKTHVVRPADRSPAWPLGVTASYYNSGLNTPYSGAMGPNDEFLWVVYRRQLCCTCCDS